MQRRFLHAADLHLGTPLGALERCGALDPHQLADLTELMQHAYTNLVDLAIDEQVSFVVLAGDVFDNADAQAAQHTRFRRGLERLHDHGIPTFVALGNHDPAAQRVTARRAFPDTVRFFRADEPEEFTVECDGLEARVAGVSFGEQAVSDNLAARFAGFERVDGGVRVGVLHTSLNGSDAHDPYAPCSVDDLSRAPVDYWALGHIHLRRAERLGGHGRWFAYPGNLQGRSFKPSECHPKGALLVPFGPDGVGEPEFRELDTVRFADLSVDVSGGATIDDTYDLVTEALDEAVSDAGGRRVVARAELTGRVEFHADLRRQVRAGAYLTEIVSGAVAEVPGATLAGVTTTVGPPIDPQVLREGDSLLAAALTRLDAMTDEQIVDDLDDLVHTRFDHLLARDAATGGELRPLIEAVLIEELAS